MKLLSLFSLVFFLSCFSYSSFDQQAFQKEIFDLKQDEYSLDLKWAIEPLDLRLDLVRQEFELSNSGSDSEVYQESYHPVGFDLGNGLFFDMNHNLSVRLDQLLSIGSKEDFSLKISQGKEDRYPVYKTREAGNVCTRTTSWLGKERTSCASIEGQGNAWRWYLNDRFCFQIEENAAQLTYSIAKDGKPQLIVAEAETETGFTIFNGRGDLLNQFQLTDEEVILSPPYVLKRDRETQELALYSRWKEKEYLNWKIKKGGNQMFLYTDRSYGYKIEWDEHQLKVYSNQHQILHIEKQYLK